MTEPYPYFDDDAFHTIQASISDEAADYNNSAAHSNDEGWFYSNDDDNELPNSDLY